MFYRYQRKSDWLMREVWRLIDNNMKFIQSCRTKDAGWFRVFGRGLRWKHEKVGLTFSERERYRKYFKIGKWIFGYLPKSKL